MNRFKCGMPDRLVLMALMLIVFSGCQSSPEQYKLRGQVVAKSESTQQLTVNHGDIPGFMSAMTMAYPVNDPQGLDAVQPGDAITADIVVDKDHNFQLEHITITGKSQRGLVGAGTASHQLFPGEKVPDVPFTDQDGKTVHLDQFKGKATLLTFIYTRCPFPTFCPLITSEFATIHNELAKTPEDYNRTHLVSISLDPEYDTAPVLRKYGLAYLGDNPDGFKQWDFVSTSPADLKKLATAFGLQYFVQDNQITHSMNTILIAPDGTVAQSWSGNDWKTSDVIAALRHVEVERD